MSTTPVDPKVSELRKTAKADFKVPSPGEKCIICGKYAGVCSTTVRCDGRNYWGPICQNQACVDAVIANPDLIKKDFTLLPN